MLTQIWEWACEK